MLRAGADEGREPIGDLFDGADAGDSIEHVAEVVAVGAAKEVNRGTSRARLVVIEADEDVRIPTEVDKATIRPLCLGAYRRDGTGITLG